MQLLKDAAFAIRIAVADPNFQVTGGGHPDPEIRGRAASVWSENKGGRPSRAPPLDPPLDSTR